MKQAFFERLPEQKSYLLCSTPVNFKQHPLQTHTSDSH